MIKESQIIGGKLVVFYEDGERRKTYLNPSELEELLEASGYAVPRRYKDVRSVEELTIDELQDALRLYDKGCSWREIADALGVPENDLPQAVSRKKRDRYKARRRERMRERDEKIVAMMAGGMTRRQVAKRLEISETMVTRAVNRINGGFYEKDVD